MWAYKGKWTTVHCWYDCVLIRRLLIRNKNISRKKRMVTYNTPENCNWKFGSLMWTILMIDFRKQTKNGDYFNQKIYSIKCFLNLFKFLIKLFKNKSFF